MMRAIIWAILTSLVAGYVIFAYATVDRRDDQARLTSLFADAAVAIQKRDIGKTIACVSENYKDPSGTNYNKLRMLTAQALRVDQEFKVEYSIKKINITGDNATADVNLTLRGNSGSPIYKRDLMITLAKENGRHALIMPATFWRITSVDNIGWDTQGGF